MKNINKKVISLPNGVYSSVWSGGLMKILINKKQSVYLETTVMVKGINCRVKVEITDGHLSLLN